VTSGAIAGTSLLYIFSGATPQVRELIRRDMRADFQFINVLLWYPLTTQAVIRGRFLGPDMTCRRLHGRCAFAFGFGGGNFGECGIG